MAATEVRRPKARVPRGARIFGYLLAIAIHAALIWFVNVAPGWRWLPFLTEDFGQLLGLVTLSLLLGAIVNLAFLVADPPWAKQLGEALTGAVSFVVLLQLARIFPFELGAGWAAWETPLRVLLWLGCIGTAIAVVAQLGAFLGGLVGDGREQDGG